MDLNALSRWESISEELDQINQQHDKDKDKEGEREGKEPQHNNRDQQRRTAVKGTTPVTGAAPSSHRASSSPAPPTHPPSSSHSSSSSSRAHSRAAPRPPSSSRLPRLPSLGSIGEVESVPTPSLPHTGLAPSSSSSLSSLSTLSPSSSDSTLSLSSSIPPSPSSSAPATPSPLTSPTHQSSGGGAGGDGGGGLLHVYDSYNDVPSQAPYQSVDGLKGGKDNSSSRSIGWNDEEEHKEAQLIPTTNAVNPPTKQESHLPPDGHQRPPLREGVLVSAGDGGGVWYTGWLYRACRRFAKGLTVGFAGKSGFALLGLLVKSKFNLRRLAAYPYLASALAGEPIAYGLFLGSMLAGLQACRDTLALSHLASSSSLTSTAVSASVSSVALYFLPASHRSSVCLFFAVRALEVLTRWTGRRYESHIPVVLREHCGTIAFCLGSAEICWAALYHTSALEPSYMAFLNAHSGKAVQSQLPLAALVHGQYNAQQPPFTAALRQYNDLRTTLTLPPLTTTTYVPVYLIPLLLFKSRRLLSSPLTVLPRLAVSISRSSLFLSLYCSMGWAWMCLFRRAGDEWGRPSHALLSGLLSGLCVLVEKRERRMELGLYVLSHSLHTAYNIAVDRRVVDYHPSLLYALLAVSLTVLLTAYQSDANTHPAATPLLRPSYASLFAYFVGKRKREATVQQQQQQQKSPALPTTTPHQQQRHSEKR